MNTIITDIEQAHILALKEQSIRDRKPTEEGYLQSNHQYAEVFHRIKISESRGSAGTLFGYYQVPLCGAKLSSSFGVNHTPTIPEMVGYRPCPKCEKLILKKSVI